MAGEGLTWDRVAVLVFSGIAATGAIITGYVNFSRHRREGRQATQDEAKRWSLDMSREHSGEWRGYVDTCINPRFVTSPSSPPGGLAPRLRWTRVPPTGARIGELCKCQRTRKFRLGRAAYLPQGRGLASEMEAEWRRRACGSVRLHDSPAARRRAGTPASLGIIIAT